MVVMIHGYFAIHVTKETLHKESTLTALSPKTGYRNTIGAWPLASRKIPWTGPDSGKYSVFRRDTVAQCAGFQSVWG